MKEDKYSRRKFIGKCLYLSAAFLGGALLLGSSTAGLAAGDETTLNPDKGSGPLSDDAIRPAAQDTIKQKKDPCDDMTGVSAEELAKRKKLAYVNTSPIEDNHCSNCALYLPPAKGKACGGCVLFKGPVRPGGYCAYWAPVNN